MREDQAQPPSDEADSDVETLATVQPQACAAVAAPWRVSLRDEDGTASAVFTLADYEQVLDLEGRLVAQGYEMLVLDERFRYCDFVLAATTVAG